MYPLARKLLLRLFIFLSIALKSSCGPGGENEPVRVNLDVRFELSSPQPAHFSFSRVVFHVNSIRFLGTRLAGNDVAFNTRPGQPVAFVDANPSRFIIPVTWFDIPEGVFNSIRWEIVTQSVGDVFFDDDHILSDDDYGFVLEGTYTRIDGTPVKLFVAMETDDVIRIESVNAQGQLPVSLIVNNEYTAEWVLNPFALLGAIPRTMFEQAEISEDDGVFYMEISSDANEDLYSLLLLSFSRNMRVVIR